MKISYNWIKTYVPDLPPHDELWGIFTYHLCEVESMEIAKDGDVIFDINILPNRAHDLLSHQGIAKELAGLLGLKFVDPTPMYKIPASTPTKLQIESQTENCRKYLGRIVRNVKISESPKWVVEHLESIGQRSINNIVDATNIVMYDCGQPCHAFDLRKIPQEKIIIKSAKDNEELELLGSEKIKAKLKNTDIVIADFNEITLGVAGVKGGLHSGVQDDTTDIVLEVANFDPVSVRKTARRLGILTDSAKHFENDLSPSLCEFAMQELSALILEMCPDAQFEDVVKYEQETTSKNHSISFTTDQINKLLGSKISNDDIASIFEKYAFKYEQKDNQFVLEVPKIRLDLNNLNDIAEEIGRYVGYHTLNPVIPRIDFVPKVNETNEKIKKIRKFLIENEYSEVMTYSFCRSGKIEVAYGTKGEEFLRTNLVDGLNKSFELNRLNAPILGLEEVKIFEIGNVFTKEFSKNNNFDFEETKIAFADKKGVQEFSIDEFFEKILDKNEVSKLLIIPKNDETTKYICEFNSSHEHTNEHFVTWSHYPFITRDIAVWVPNEIDPEILFDIFVKEGNELLARPPKLFDKFTKDDKTSFAFHLVFQAQNRTLTDAETYTIVDNINNTLKNKGFTTR